MSASRAAGFLVGVAVLAASSSFASGDRALSELPIPDLPDAALVIGATNDLAPPRRPDPAGAAQRLRADADRAAPTRPSIELAPEVPPVVVTVAPSPADPVVSPTDAGVAATMPANPVAASIAARLTDPRIPLHPRLGRPERDALSAFYALGNFEPVWLKDGAWTAAGLAIIERLRSAGEEGLDPGAYPAPALGLHGRDASPADLADAELRLAALAALYARDARGARIEPSRLSHLITPKLELPGADAVLTNLAGAPDAGQALAAYNPPHEGYRALKRKLAEIRAGASARSRLEGDILANMERWRWLPADMGRRHVWVNIPEFKLRLVKEGRSTYEARVIVGKPDTQTPVFSDEMDHAVVNPSWYVPPSIFKNEFHSDPDYAAARGYDVVRGKNGAVSIRQPPGERNALGFIKFMFPNQHAVYLHDTPNRRLFGAEKRAFSHGCVRLDQPFRFGEFVLGEQWTETRLKSLIGAGERSIRLPEKMPVHLTYFTVFVDEGGELRQANDLYAVNNKVRVALGWPSDGTVVVEAKRVRTAVAGPERQRVQPSPRLREPAPPRIREAAPRPQARPRPAPPRPVQVEVRAPAVAAEPPFWWWTTR